MQKIKQTHVFIGFIAVVVCYIMTSFSAFASDLQKFFVQNNDTVLAIISQKELSRFVFKNDKVKKVFVIGGELHYEMLDENLYIKPSILKPVNFFVSTEKGNTYKIIATPKDIPATQIFVSSQRGKQAHTSLKQQLTGESVYTTKIAKIIKVVISEDDTILDYKFKNMSKTKTYEIGLKDYFVLQVKGDGLVAEKHILVNQSEEPITIHKQWFDGQDTDAIYIEKEVIEPGKSASVIKVRGL